MQLKSISSYKSDQRGASLIEVLVAVLLLSFGMLSLGSMLAFSVQLPKLSDFRAVATNLASSHVERMRANPLGFSAGSYVAALNDSSWSLSQITYSSGSDCSYPNCTSATLATKDIQDARIAIRRQLPGGDMMVKCSNPSPCTKASTGEIWVVWQEPSTFAVLDPSSSDSCASEITSAYSSPNPRCLYVRFKIE